MSLEASGVIFNKNWGIEVKRNLWQKQEATLRTKILDDQKAIAKFQSLKLKLLDLKFNWNSNFQK